MYFSVFFNENLSFFVVWLFVLWMDGSQKTQLHSCPMRICEDLLTFKGCVDDEVHLKYHQCVGVFESLGRKSFFFFFIPICWQGLSMENKICVLPLAFGPAELLLKQEPELIKHVSTDLTEGMRAC